MRGWLLDTNVVSEMVRPRPEDRVIAWLRDIPEERAFISVLTLAEIDQGIETLPEADDRRERYRRFRSHLETQFSSRILDLDNETIRLWGSLSGRYRRAFGGKAPVIDAVLAATAQRRRLYLATRNVRDVRQFGGSAFDPWADHPADFPLQI
jgi:predicted nucleic acid-binding protein